MQSSHPDPSRHSGESDRPDQRPEQAPARGPERHAPGRDDEDREPAAPRHGQHRDVRKPPNRR